MSERWQTEKLYYGGDPYFADVLAAINEAKRTVLLETYIYDPDPLGAKIEEALVKAAQRGVTVRVLVDGIGAARWIDRRSPEFDLSGARLRVYHPIVFSKIASSFLQNLGFRKRATSKNWFSRINKRDHRKITMIDEERAFVGSLNVSRVHCLSLSGDKAWRDTGIQVTGDAIQDLVSAFDHAWLRSHAAGGKRRWRDTLFHLPFPFAPKNRELSPLVRLNYTLKLRRKNSKDFKARLKKAERRLWLTNAYLAPSAPLVRQISAAAERGLDVRLLVPRKSDVFFMPWVASSHYAPLLKAGVRIFEYLPRFLHAKSVFIDDWATVGTSNMNRRSALYDYEVDVVVTHAESLASLEEQFHKDMQLAEEILAARIGFSAVLGRFFAFLFRRWI